MTIKELITGLVGKEHGWCLCPTPDLNNMSLHVEQALVEKLVERVIDRCQKALTDALHENGIVDMKDADESNGKWIREEFRKRVFPDVAQTR